MQRKRGGQPGHKRHQRKPFEPDEIDVTWTHYYRVAVENCGTSNILRDCVEVTISRGQLRKVVAKVSDSLLDPYEQLLTMLPTESTLNIDETGHSDAITSVLIAST